MSTHSKGKGYRVVCKLDARRMLVRTMDRRLEIMVKDNPAGKRTSARSMYNSFGSAMHRLINAGAV